MKLNKHIEIARATKGHRSSMGQSSCDSIVAVLEQHYERVGVTIVNEQRDLESLVAKRPDLVFLGIRKVPVSLDKVSPAKIWTSAYLDEHHLQHTGSSVSALTLDINKPLAKRVVQAAGLDTATFFSAHPGQYDNEAGLPQAFPLFIKPPASGGSKGIGPDSVVRDFAAFEQKVASMHQQFQTDALVEAYLPGREFTVAVMATGQSDELIAMPVELIAEPNANGDSILGKDVKTADTERVVAITDHAVKQTVMSLAIDVFKALGARDFGRIDIRMDEQGRPHFLEANLMPGLSNHGYLSRCFYLNKGMSYQDMLLSIVARGLAEDRILPPGIKDIVYPTQRITPLISAPTLI